MKKFLIFMIICVVTASLGLLTYRLATVEANINVNQNVFYCNVFDAEVPLEITVENDIRNTTIYTVKSQTPTVVNWSDTSDKLVIVGGGEAYVEITSNIKNFRTIYIQVKVGSGTQTNPYYIKNVNDLKGIGTAEYMDLDKSYILTADLDLSAASEAGLWTPIASVAENGFVGSFDFNNHTLSNMKVNDTENGYTGTNAGLFAKIGATGLVSNINMENAQISGNYQNIGAVAGENLGTINYAKINDSILTATGTANLNLGAIAGYSSQRVERSSVISSQIKQETTAPQAMNIGGIVGTIYSISLSKTRVDRCYTEGVTINAVRGNIGGIVGNNAAGVIVNSYSGKSADNVLGSITVVNNTANSVGGVVGKISFANILENYVEASLLDCYSTVIITSTQGYIGAIIGSDLDYNFLDRKINIIAGCYYSTEKSGISAGIGFASGEISAENYGVYSTLDIQKTLANGFFSWKGSDEISHYWAWIDVWYFDEGLTYPILNMSGPKVQDPSAIAGGRVETIADLSNIRTNLYGTYILYNDIYLGTYAADNIPQDYIEWSPIGTKENPFMGTLRAAETPDSTPSNKKYYKIYGLTITQNTTEVQGLFGYIGSTGVVENLTLVDVNIKNGTIQGSVAGVNEGIILNCGVDCGVAINNAMQTSRTESALYAEGENIQIMQGGIAGSNQGTINIAKVSGLRMYVGSSATNIVSFVGGIVGRNCLNSTVKNASFINGFNNNGGVNGRLEVSSTITTYMGGIAGYNNGIVDSGKFSSNYITTSSNGSFGGIVGSNDSKGIVRYSLFKGEMTLKKGAGIVGSNIGTFFECTSDGIIEGDEIAGLVQIMNSNIFHDCISLSTLNGISDKSNKCGVAVFVALENEDQQLSRGANIIAACSFGGKGTNYYETMSQVRSDSDMYTALGLLRTQRDAGFLLNSVYDKEVGGSARRSIYGYGEYLLPGFQEPYCEYKTDTPLTTAQCQGTDGNYQVFIDYGFARSTWNFENVGSYPTLKNCVK